MINAINIFDLYVRLLNRPHKLTFYGTLPFSGMASLVDTAKILPSTFLKRTPFIKRDPEDITLHCRTNENL